MIDTVKPKVTGFFDEGSNTISYVVQDPESHACAIVDAVMEFDLSAGHLTFDGADKIIAHIRERGLKLEWLIETHVHADHLSAAPYIQERLGGKIGVGELITVVQDTFGKIFTRAPNFSVMAASSMRSLPMGRSIILARSGPVSSIPPATRPPAMCM